MANEGMPNFQVPPEMRALAEQSVEQARKAFDGFLTATQRAVSTADAQVSAAQASAKDLGQKAVGFAERNVAASFDFAQQLLKAKDPQEVMKLHADFVKSQMQAFSEQAKELAQTATKGAMNQASRSGG